MAAGLGDLIQITDYQTYIGQQVLNVYYYRVTSITGLAGNYLQVLAEWYRDTVLPPVRAIQNVGVIHTSIEARNLSNGIDFYQLAISLTGNIVLVEDQRSPSFMSVGFKLNRESLATRNGYKRYAGLDEGKMRENNYNIGTTESTNLQNALALDIILGAVTVAEPIIVRKPLPDPVGTGFTYSSIGSASYRGLGTQNTRKPGRGS